MIKEFIDSNMEECTTKDKRTKCFEKIDELHKTISGNLIEKNRTK